MAGGRVAARRDAGEFDPELELHVREVLRRDAQDFFRDHVGGRGPGAEQPEQVETGRVEQREVLQYVQVAGHFAPTR